MCLAVQECGPDLYRTTCSLVLEQASREAATCWGCSWWLISLSLRCRPEPSERSACSHITQCWCDIMHVDPLEMRRLQWRWSGQKKNTSFKGLKWHPVTSASSFPWRASSNQYAKRAATFDSGLDWSWRIIQCLRCSTWLLIHSGNGKQRASYFNHMQSCSRNKNVIQLLADLKFIGPNSWTFWNTVSLET